MTRPVVSGIGQSLSHSRSVLAPAPRTMTLLTAIASAGNGIAAGR
jgi:hypothetical protein